jgi:hypothetical protein
MAAHGDTEVSHLDGAHESKAACENAPVPAVNQILDGRDKIDLLDCWIVKRMKGERCGSHQRPWKFS